MSESRPLGVGSRFTSGPAASLAESAFRFELAATPVLAKGLSFADMAHVALLLEHGLVAEDRGRALLAGLLEAHRDALELPRDPYTGDVFNNRDAFLAERLGSDANLVHTGRARREATTIAWQLACRERLLDAGLALATLCEVMTDACGHHRRSVMPDYTYLQRAHPTTLGHYLLGSVFPLLRDIERLERALACVNRSPAAAGSVNGSRLPLDRRRAAALLEFSGLIEHTRDAMWAPDMALECMAALVSTMTTADRLAEDLLFFATEEVGFVALDDAHCRNSVIMPHKKNPYGLSFLRGYARALVGRYVGVATSNLTPSGQPDNRIFAYLDVPQAIDNTTRCLTYLADALAKARFDVERMRTTAGEGYTYSTDLCDFLVETRALDARSAHRVIGRAVRDCLEVHVPVTLAAVRGAAAALGVALGAVDEEAFDRCRDVDDAIERRRGVGGAGDEPMQAMLERARAHSLAAIERWRDHALHGFEARFTTQIRRASTSAADSEVP